MTNIWLQKPLPKHALIAKALGWETTLDVVSTLPIRYEECANILDCIPTDLPDKAKVVVRGHIVNRICGNYSLQFDLLTIDGDILRCKFPQFAKPKHKPFMTDGVSIILRTTLKQVPSRDPENPNGHSWTCMYPDYIRNPMALTRAVYRASGEFDTYAIADAITDHLNALADKLGDNNEHLIPIVTIHQPKTVLHAHQARRAIAETEVKAIAGRIAAQQKLVTNHLSVPSSAVDQVIAAGEFTPTACQEKAVHNIVTSMRTHGLQRHMLSADTGCGKTKVMCDVASVVAQEPYNGNVPPIAVQAPTTLLAEQLAIELSRMCKDLNVWLHGSKAPVNPHVIVGTTGIFSVYGQDQFPRLLVVDEEHRFGVADRDRLLGKDTFMLAMTATPIPRSAGLLMGGGYCVHTLKTMPKPRIVTTQILRTPFDRKAALDSIIKELNAGGKIIVIYPAIDESEAMQSIKDNTPQWEKLWPHGMAIVHSEIADAKSQMDSFRTGKVRLMLASTKVQEGIDIPDATTILIVQAERFGIASLHQMRGRVGRGGLPGRCLLTSDNDTARERLEFFRNCNDGFELAEYDMKRRGMGEITGIAQKGHMFRFFQINEDLDLLNILADEKEREVCAA